ncbi:MAG: nucleotide sugar dehydrogenase [Candidatus Omnitrophota bacterium]|nr:nucleotide sugar dehydrogenase [Candidatus Omnitrophota bacterium]
MNHKEKIAVVGLGYVGLPLAVAFAKKNIGVVGFDIDENKVRALRDGIDITCEISATELNLGIYFTTESNILKGCTFIIVAVPTPIDGNKTPDLNPLAQATEIIGQNLTKGSVVVFESTVYPGVTEEFCIPILEKNSGLSWKHGHFFVGYSPERINPGDKEHCLEKVVKVVSGQNEEVCNEVANVYRLIVPAGVYQTESIKVAEAAKVIENTQRDLNIALMNELAIIFHKIGISTESVLNAASTKWNFLNFYPGLVGGHCIGVDPYYLTCKAEQLGYHPQVVLAGRRINDFMGIYIAQQTIKQMIKARKVIEGANILVLGLTFKENVPDFRNSRVFDVISELKTYGVNVFTNDPFFRVETLDSQAVHIPLVEAQNMDVIIIATPHDEYKKIPLSEYRGYCKKLSGTPVLIDLRWLFNKEEAEKNGFHYWRL